MSYRVFLSPAQHHKTCLVAGCSEATHANAIAAAMEPWLALCALQVLRNLPTTERPADHVRRANDFGADVYLALHTNAGGGRRCTFYNDGSAAARTLTEHLAAAYGQTYPYLVKPGPRYPASGLREYWNELTDSHAPAAYAELWFHDNEEDAAWGHAHLAETALALSCGLCDHLGVARPTEYLARTVTALAGAADASGQLAAAQCLHDRLAAPGRFGADYAAQLTSADLPTPAAQATPAALQAVEAVFLQGERAFAEPVYFAAAAQSPQAQAYDRHHRRLGTLGDVTFWGKELAPGETNIPPVIEGDPGEEDAFAPVPDAETTPGGNDGQTQGSGSPASQPNAPADRDDPVPPDAGNAPQPGGVQTCPYAAPMAGLTLGARGDGVRYIQWHLLRRGYALPGGISGVYDGPTGRAIRMLKARLRIRTRPKEVCDGAILAALPRYALHTVQPGETLCAIAARYGLAPAQLLRHNALADATHLRPGMTLIIEGGNHAN